MPSPAEPFKPRRRLDPWPAPSAAFEAAMNRDEPKPKPVITTARAEARAERHRRLAEALRDNLKRRKDQSRVRADSAGERPPGDSGEK